MAERLLITIKVVPSAGKSGCVLKKGGQLTCMLKSPPERGKANDELIQFIARALKVPKNQVTIVRGHTSRTKVVAINAAINLETLYHALGIDVQQSVV